MSPFIQLKKSSQYGGFEDYLVNVNHIVRITRSDSGSQVFTLNGDFFCDETPARIELMISQVLEQKGVPYRVIERLSG